MRFYPQPLNASPVMNALNIANECVALPARETRRIQPTSYMNDVAPVTAAATKNNEGRGPVPAVRASAAPGVAAANQASERPNHQRARFRSPAVSIVPGNPTAPTNQKPLARTPIAAPRLVK
jgi:hypothetical protein